jgi:hypothetical protein
MPVGVTDLAHSLRISTASSPVPIPLSRGQQLVAAALGHKSLASLQAAQASGREPAVLDAVPHIVLNIPLATQRAGQLGIDVREAQLQTLLLAAFADRLPEVDVHDSFDEFAVAFDDQMQDAVMSDESVNSEMANANYDGVDEVYFQILDQPDDSLDDPSLTVNVHGQVTLGLDLERPYSGHQVNCTVDLTMQRQGRRCFGPPQIRVHSADLDQDWGDDDNQDDGPPMRTLAHALAHELGIGVTEARELADAQPQELSGSSGDMTYGYLFDFTEHASPPLAAKLLNKRGSQKLEVGPGFFEGIVDDDFLR